MWEAMTGRTGQRARVLREIQDGPKTLVELRRLLPDMPPATVKQSCWALVNTGEVARMGETSEVLVAFPCM